MRCPNAEQWALLSMALLDKTQAGLLEAHLQRCASCRRAYELACKDHHDVLSAHRTFERGHDALRARLMAALPEEPPGSERIGSVHIRLRRLGERVMMFHTTRWGRAVAGMAAAACLVVGFLAFRGGNHSRAFAGAITRLREAETISCHVRMTMKAKMKPVKVAQAAGRDAPRRGPIQEFKNVREEKLYISAYEGMRRDTYDGDTPVNTLYVDAEGGDTVVVNHVDRTYQVFQENDAGQLPENFREAMGDLLAERPLAELHFAGPFREPQRLIDGLRRLVEEADGELGQRTINGREAFGFEVTGERTGFGPPLYGKDDQLRTELWVDAEDDVLLEVVLHLVSRVEAVRDLPLSATFTITAVYDQFELDPPLPAGWFDPVIPKDYSPVDAEMAALVGHLNEEAFIEALRVFSETAGRYPKSLQAMDLVYEVSYVVGSLQARRLAAKQKGQATASLPDPDKVGARLQGLAYYMVLQSNGAQPEYFGDQVQPGDAARVLLRWLLDDQRTRVVYGDLNVETIPE